MVITNLVTMAALVQVLLEILNLEEWKGWKHIFPALRDWRWSCWIPHPQEAKNKHFNPESLQQQLHNHHLLNLPPQQLQCDQTAPPLMVNTHHSHSLAPVGPPPPRRANDEEHKDWQSGQKGWSWTSSTRLCAVPLTFQLINGKTDFQ